LGEASLFRQPWLLPLESLTAETAPDKFIASLQLLDTVLQYDAALARKLASLSVALTNERMLLQLALSLGYSSDPVVFEVLINIARKHGGIRWMPDAIVTGVKGRAGAMLSSLLTEPGLSGDKLFEPLAACVAARRDPAEIGALLHRIASLERVELKAKALKGLNTSIQQLKLNTAARLSLDKLLKDDDLAVQGMAVTLAGKLNVGDSKALDGLRKIAADDAKNADLPVARRLAAITLLAESPDSIAIRSLIAAFPQAGPPLTSAIIDALLSQRKRIEAFVDAVAKGIIPIRTMTPVQKALLLEKAEGRVREKVDEELAKAGSPDREAIFQDYAKALGGSTDKANGEKLFRQMCSSCHHVGDIGVEVGPDLKNSYGNSNETILRNILFPDEKIASGFETYQVVTHSDENYRGVLVSESAGSVVIRQIGGGEKTFLRKDIRQITSLSSSLMPAFDQSLGPQECADIIGWLKAVLSK